MDNVIIIIYICWFRYVYIRKLSNNRVKKNRLNNHLLHSKNILFDAHGLDFQHLVPPMKIMQVQ
jgi:hypothetical protein